MAKALEGEADGVDEADAGAHEGIAQLQAQQIVLRLGRAVLDGMQQRRVHAGEAGEHLGIAAVALAFGAGDGVELARVGDQDHGAQVGEVTADPRTVRARFQRDGGVRKLAEQLRECGTGVGQGRLADNLAGGIQHADMMCPITKIQTEGEPTDDSGRGVGNEGRSKFSFHRQTLPDAPLRRAVCLLI